MQEQEKVQQVPVKMYRTPDRLMVAAPMPGMEPCDVLVQVEQANRLIIRGKVRALLKNTKELLMDEWSVGIYYRELTLPNAVDGANANVTYGNGVLVVALPISERTTPATLTMDKTATAHGDHVGNAGHPVA
ncbi:MAG TPA: Hsp20/alpha crystallin family protein [Ktedonobacteraceae bacterium]|jgi:HSP20 family protein|nr:Hsp20/alpha crystallin family protein [Ktedonobacteraceae bacterium]